MRFFLNFGIVIAVLFTVALLRVSLAGGRRRKRSTERLEVRSSAPASAEASTKPQVPNSEEQVRVPISAGTRPRTPEVERNGKVVAETKRQA
jgi:hypothetical protein